MKAIAPTFPLYGVLSILKTQLLLSLLFGAPSSFRDFSDKFIMVRLVFFLLLPHLAFSQGRFLGVPDVGNKEEKVFEKDTYYVIFNHPSSAWDPRSSSQEGVLRLFDLVKSQPERFETLLSVDGAAFQHDYLGERYFLRDSEVQHVVRSDGGSHRLSFPNSDILVFSGGNLSMCLCEFLRDTIRSSLKPEGPLEMVLVTDATYDNFYELMTEGYPIQNLEDMLNIVGEATIWAHFDEHVFGAKKLCPWQDTSEQDPIDPKDYTFSLIRNGSSLKQYGDGSKRVNIHLTSVSNFERTVDEIEDALRIDNSGREVLKELGEKKLEDRDGMSVEQ